MVRLQITTKNKKNKKISKQKNLHHYHDKQNIIGRENLPKLMHKDPRTVSPLHCKHQINYALLQTSYQEASNPDDIKGTYRLS